MPSPRRGHFLSIDFAAKSFASWVFPDTVPGKLGPHPPGLLEAGKPGVQNTPLETHAWPPQISLPEYARRSSPGVTKSPCMCFEVPTALGQILQRGSSGSMAVEATVRPRRRGRAQRQRLAPTSK